MATMRPIQIKLLLLLASLTVLVLFFRAFRSSNIGTVGPLTYTSEYSALHKSVNVIDLAGRGPDYDSIPCFNMTKGQFRFPVCTYPPEVDGPSRILQKNKGLDSGETKEATNLVKPLESDAGLMFMDLGVHMGFYSIPPAMKGHQVLAVEANPVTARITRKSFVLANVTDKVTLVQNGLSNKRMKMVLGSNVPNRASTYLLGTGDCPEGQKCVSESTNTIFLDDLLPLMKSDRTIMKVDIQGSEIDCFTEATASKFFSKIEVPFIRMEWAMYQNKYASVRSYTKEQVDQWLPFFYRRNYTVHDPYSGALLGSDWMDWPYDVVFKKPYRNMGLL